MLELPFRREKPGLKIWEPKKKVTDPPLKRVTVFRQLGGIGDFLMTTPVYRGLKEKCGPDCHVTLATDHAYAACALPMLARNNPFIDQIVRVNPFEFVASPTRYVRHEFRNTPNHEIPHCVIETDLVIDLNVVCAQTETAQQPNVTIHRTDIWCQAAGVNPSSKKPILVLTPEELAEGRRWCDQYLGEGVRIGIALSAADPARDWPFSSQFAWEMHQIGYKAVTIDKLKRAHPDVPAMLGMDIRKVAAAIAHLDAVVSPDTGILHVAGALGVPVLGLFGPTDGALRMREYAGSYTNPKALVECSPCWYIHGCRREKDRSKHFVCMRRITKELVFYELEQLLRRFGKEPL